MDKQKGQGIGTDFHDWHQEGHPYYDPTNFAPLIPRHHAQPVTYVLSGKLPLNEYAFVHCMNMNNLAFCVVTESLNDNIVGRSLKHDVLLQNSNYSCEKATLGSIEELVPDLGTSNISVPSLSILVAFW